jgi:DNA-binding transcriptional regulator YhcF (GntR family)
VTIPPYQRIAGEIAARIAAGTLAPGDRVPSTRRLTVEHGVAMATATKVIATLREQGLVTVVPGVGTVVAERTRPAGAAPDRDRVVRTAVTIADAEGLTGLSMRRLAADLGMPTMSLYRYVVDKEELVLFMMDAVFAGNAPPALSPATDGWRPCVEALARHQWAMYRRHPWLAEAVSFTRPLPAGRAMAHTEWAMAALDGHGLDPGTQFCAAVMLANHVRGTAVNIEREAQAVQESGIDEGAWMDGQQARFAEVLGSGRYPMMARFMTADDVPFDLDLLMEFGLQRLLDGLALLIEATTPQVSEAR